MTTLPAERAGQSLPGERRPLDRLRLPGELTRDLAAVCLPAGLALLLCLVGITARSLGFDEAASVAIASQHGSALGAAIAHDGGNMAGYYLLLHVVTSAFGDGLLAIRAPSALASAITVGLVSLLGLRLFDRRVAVIAGLLAAVSLPLIFWGQSARGYAPMVALSTGSFAAFVALARPGSESRGAIRRAWLAYVLCTALAVYAGFVAVLIVPVQLLLVLGRRAALRRVGSALLVAALCWTPLVVLATSRGSGQLFWVPRPSLTIEKQVLEALTSAGLEPSIHATVLTYALLAMTALILVSGALIAAARRRFAWNGLLLVAWLAVPVLIAWLESLVGQPIFLARNLLTVLPAVALLLALAATRAGPARPAVGLVLLLLLALRAVQVAAGYGVSPEDWRSATTYVLSRSAPGDCVAFYPSDARMAFAYYVPTGARPPRSVLPAAPWARSRPYVEDYTSLSSAAIRSLPARCPRIWLVSSHQGQPDGPPAAREHLTRFRALQSALGAEYADRRTAGFGYAATITVERLSAPRGGAGRRSRP